MAEPAYRGTRTGIGTRPLDVFCPRNRRIDNRGIPLPADNAMKANGEPDDMFDPALERRILYQRRCGVCGDYLGDEFVLVGDDRAERTRRFYVAGIHEDCLKFSFGWCPFLATPTFGGNPNTPKRSIRKGEPLLVYITDGYRILHLRYFIRLKFLIDAGQWGRPILKANPPIRTYYIRDRKEATATFLPKPECAS